MENLARVPLCVGAFLMDAAIFFLIIRLLTHILPIRPLILMDRVGSVGVDSVTQGISRVVQPWCVRPLSPRQQEAMALFMLSVVRCILGAILS